ncbi:hypothetical protein [Rubneribacter sp.]
MKRKEAKETIAKVGGMTFHVGGTMTLFNNKSGKEVEADMPQLLSIVRGVLVWCSDLLDDGGKEDLSTTEQLHRLLTIVGKSIALDLSGDGDE